MRFPAPAAVPPMVALGPVSDASRIMPSPISPISRAFVPVASVPMKLPWMTMPDELPLLRIPLAMLPEIRFRSPGFSPPMVLFGESVMSMPLARES